MGQHEGWAQPTGLLPNGLLPNEGSSAIRVLDTERWLIAEERTAELIACIQPNQPSEELRNAVADYVQRIVVQCFPCQVFTFGSVPLKTYLPDGDIDLTAFSNNQNLKDTWANQVRDMLQSEEKNENAEFRVKEVQYIQAEVKIIKCLVENIVVDISFNQLGGLCTLCFLEEVDHLINQNHLFKRSIILIKAWCYYESRILGAHHGLISTYALETLVLYIFHVFNNSFTGPLEVLYRFLEFFSSFDWDNFCVSLWGPVPISSLPDVTAEPPRQDSGELLLSKLFLDACSSVYAVFPHGQEKQGQSFISKHFNVIDPLRVNNNLGRSVSKGNFFRIRSAFAFGAKRLARLLDPKENIIFEVNQLFMNTWERHGSGHRPDTPRTDLWRLRFSNSNQLHGSENWVNISSNKRLNSNSDHEAEVERTHASHGVSWENLSRNSDISAVSPAQSQKNHGTLNSSRIPDQISPEINSNQGVHTDRDQGSFKPDQLVNDLQGRYLFARTHSSPELTDTYTKGSSRGRHNRAPENGKDQITSTRLDNSRRKNLGSEIFVSNSTISTDDTSSVRHVSSHQSLDGSADSNTTLNSYYHGSALGAMGDQLSSVMGTQGMHQEEQDLVNMMASSTLHNFNVQVHLPLNLGPAHLPLPFSPSILASMGYCQRNLTGMVPTNVPLIEPAWGASNMQFPQGEADHDLWHEQDGGSTAGFDPDNGGFEVLQLDNKQQPTSSGFNFLPASKVGGSSGSMGVQPKFIKENLGSAGEDHVDAFHHQDNRQNEVHSDGRTASSRFSPSRPTSPLRSKTSSESSWDGSSAKVSKPTRERRGRKTSFEPAHVSGSDSLIPISPVFLGSGSQQRAVDNSGVVPFAFYPTGATDATTSHFGGDNGVDNSDSSQNFDSSEGLDQSGNLNTSGCMRRAVPVEPSEVPKSDILNSDFASHWQNLQYGRYCQSPHSHGPLSYPSPIMVPPMYLQGHFPWDGPGRPLSSNMNLFTHLMNYGPRFVPVAPLQSVSNRPANVYQHYGDEATRYRTGTGTYLPNPKVSARERHASNSRRGNYHYDRGNHNGDREGNWNINSKSRTAGRNHSRNQADKSSSRLDRLAASESRADRPRGSYRHDSFPSYHSQNGPLHVNSPRSGSASVAYGMYPIPTVNPNEVSSNGPNVPSVVMVYPYEHNTNYGSQAEQPEFGSIGTAGFSGMNEEALLNEGTGAFEEQRFHGGVSQQSPSDQPSSPHCQRRI
ncbi:unnamed protein product, partial [Vitis vinifera]